MFAPTMHLGVPGRCAFSRGLPVRLRLNPRPPLKAVECSMDLQPDDRGRFGSYRIYETGAGVRRVSRNSESCLSRDFEPSDPHFGISDESGVASL